MSTSLFKLSLFR